MGMFDELFNSLYADLPDKEKYLERIGMDSDVKPTKETLDALILAHLRTVPFENLDVCDADTDISLSIPHLYEKIVTNRRGGYCYELNAAFTALLKAVGFECYPIAVRVVWGATRFMPISHRAAIVTIDGVRYFADVGFGGPSPQGALMIDDPGEQPSGVNVFVVDKGGEHGIVINRLVDGKKEQLLMFKDTPVDPVDFLALNEYQAKSKYSMFRIARLVNLVTEEGAKSLSGSVLKIYNYDIGDTSEMSFESQEELRAALKEHFDIDVDFTLKMG